MPIEALLAVNNLTISFKNAGVLHHAVNDINFTVNRGETLGIVGESGSGKSLTSLAILGLLPPQGAITNGEIIFNSPTLGEVILNDVTPQVYRNIRGNQIAMIFQEPMTALNPVHTCGNQVAEVMKLHLKYSNKEAYEATISLFEQVKLPRVKEMFHAYPHQLSGGQKQRVMIAMAIACKPALLIADEPTTALDVTVQQSILDLLLDLKNTYNMGMIFITHDLGVVAQVAQNVMVMQKGEMIEKGNAINLFKAPKQPYTKGLIACKPPLNTRPERLLTVSDFLSNDSEKIAIKNITTIERESTLAKLYRQPPLLEVKNLSTRFVTATNMWGTPTHYLNALNQISFDVFKGETIGLVGESGCGKSTLGRSILRLTPSFKGEVIYNDVNLLNLSNHKMREMRSKMQLIFQDPYSSLNPRITIGAAIEEPMLAHHIYPHSEERKEAVLELIKRVGLNENFYNRYPHEFSGGQRQRIGIARTLALKPEFIVCDESVSALDVSVQAQVLNLLNELKHDFNLTYIFISHDLSVVKYMCDRMIVMRNGIIEEIGDADAIYKNPQSDYTRSLINAIPKMANMANA